MDLLLRSTRHRGSVLLVAASVVAAASAFAATPVDASVQAPTSGAAALQAETDVLALAGSATDATVAGGAIDGAVTVTNIGSEDMVRAALTIDSDVTETLVEVGVPAGWTCRDIAFVAGQDLFCDAGTFSAGTSATFTFRATTSSALAVGDVVVTTITANAEEPVQDVHPQLALSTRIVAPAAPAPAPVAVAPQFTG